jgi:DNA segregation ATPase FtsK/SpoIIIE-like protein
MKWIKKNSVEIVLGLGLVSFLTVHFGDEYLVPVTLLVLGLIMLYRRHFRMRHADSSVFFESMYDDRDGDDLYEDAKEAVIEAGKASTSYLQRKLRVGYSRAARLMDMLEEKGVIGAQEGSAPREVLKNRDEKQEDQQ